MRIAIGIAIVIAMIAIFETTQFGEAERPCTGTPTTCYSH